MRGEEIEPRVLSALEVESEGVGKESRDGAQVPLGQAKRTLVVRGEKWK